MSEPMSHEDDVDEEMLVDGVVGGPTWPPQGQSTGSDVTEVVDFFSGPPSLSSPLLSPIVKEYTTKKSPSLSLPPLSPIVKEYTTKRNNQVKISRVLLPGQYDQLISKFPNLSRLSRIHVNPPKALLWLPYKMTPAGLLWTVGEHGSGDWARECLMRFKTPGEMLQTTEIDWGMDICRKQNPHMDGLQSEIVYSPCMMDPVYVPTRKFVQILNVKNHWSTFSNVFSDTEDALKGYDSDFRELTYGSQEQEQISRLLRPKGDHIKLDFVTNIQQQSPHSNLCGHYAIAFAIALCKNIKPEYVRIDETTVRDGMATVMEAHIQGRNDEYNVDLGNTEPQLKTMLITLCRFCNKACDPCRRCGKGSHEECRWFNLVPPPGHAQEQKLLTCKLCQV